MASPEIKHEAQDNLRKTCDGIHEKFGTLRTQFFAFDPVIVKEIERVRNILSKAELEAIIYDNRYYEPKAK